MSTVGSPNSIIGQERKMEQGALVVRRSIQIAASPERVWKEFESVERFARWWSTDRADRSETVIKYEPRAGGRIEFSIDTHRGDVGTIAVSGNVVSVTPGREITFELEFLGQGWEAPTLVTIELTPNGYGTLVEIRHYGFERIGASAVDNFHGFQGGWDLRELEGLRALAEA